MRTIVIANQKGGVAKTTTAIAMAAQLSRLGYRVLGVDFDPQGDMTFGVGVGQPETTVYELMTGASIAKNTIVKAKQFDLIPAGIMLAEADVSFANDDNGYYKLRDALRPLRNKYDFCIIDCKPSFGLLPLNAMMAADDVIIPIESGVFSVAALNKMIQTIEQVRGVGNPKIRLRGILITRCSMFTRISKEITSVATEMSKVYETHVFGSAIHSTVDVPEAQKNGIDVGEYRPSSKAAKDYAAFVDEYLQLIGKPPVKENK